MIFKGKQSLTGLSSPRSSEVKAGNLSASLFAGVVLRVCCGVPVCPPPAWGGAVGGGISARWPMAPVVFFAVCFVRAISDGGGARMWVAVR